MSRLLWKNWVFLLTSLCLSTQCLAGEGDGDTEEAGGRVSADLLSSVAAVPAVIQESVQVLLPASHCDNVRSKRKRKGGSDPQQNATAPGSPVKKLNRLSLSSGGFAFNYKSQLDYHNGDLLYGLQTGREETLSSLKRDYPEGKAFTVDVFNNLILGHFRAPGKGLITQEDLIRERVAGLVQSGKLHGLDADRFGRYLLFLGRGMSVEKQKMESDDFIREACILAIFFTAQERQKIHFVLDGFDPRHAVDVRNRHYGSFTGHEFRAIVDRYREDPSILNSIEFYEAGERFDPAKKNALMKSMLGAGPGQLGVSPPASSAAPEVLPAQGSAVEDYSVHPRGSVGRILNFSN